MSNKIGILLINLGTPAAPTTQAVRRYLREFLSDPWVIDLPLPLRWTLVQLIIAPFRAKASAHAYQSIWTEQGSPLLTHSQAIAKALQQQRPNDWVVSLGMRYGQPSINNAIQSLHSHQVQEMIIVPLYPQYAESTTRSSLELAQSLIKKQTPSIRLHSVSHFYHHPAYIEALAHSIQQALPNQSVDQLVLSYHGLPERHIQKTCQINCHRAPQAHKPCPAICDDNHQCYRAQCYATTRAVSQALNCPTDRITTSFQSRLGKTPWIQPYTDQLLEELAQAGHQHIAIACPAFVADCLETLEEIGMQAQQQWQELGGSSFQLIPCLNSHPEWIQALAAIIDEQLKEPTDEDNRD